MMRRGICDGAFEIKVQLFACNVMDYSWMLNIIETEYESTGALRLRKMKLCP
jgi:hypothetical protein